MWTTSRRKSANGARRRANSSRESWPSSGRGAPKARDHLAARPGSRSCLAAYRKVEDSRGVRRHRWSRRWRKKPSRVLKCCPNKEADGHWRFAARSWKGSARRAHWASESHAWRGYADKPSLRARQGRSPELPPHVSHFSGSEVNYNTWIDAGQLAPCSAKAFPQFRCTWALVGKSFTFNFG